MRPFDALNCKSIERALWNKYGSRVGHIDMMVKEEGSEGVWLAYNEMGDEFRIVTFKGHDGTTKYTY